MASLLDRQIVVEHLMQASTDDRPKTRCEPLVIVGSGGHGREVLDIVEAINEADDRYDFLGFLDDGHPEMGRLERRRASVLGPVRLLAEIDTLFVIGIGQPSVRREVDLLVAPFGRRSPVLVHPSATIGTDVEFGPGSIVWAQVGVTTNVRGGRHVHLNQSCSVAHDTLLGDYAIVSPGARLSGNVSLGEGVMIGTNACVIQGLAVGEWAVVGAGAVVTRPIPAGTTVVGVPALPREMT